MRGSIRLLAQVQPAKFLEANAPTGLTGVLTHPRPRAALLYTYSQTLRKLQDLPESSVYRQSAEAITRSRLKIVENTIPARYEEWRTRIKTEIAKKPEAYAHVRQEDGSISFSEAPGQDSEIWDGEPRVAFGEGPQSEASSNSRIEAIIADDKRQETEPMPKPSELEQEPPLDADQYAIESLGCGECVLTTHSRISDIEEKIGAGLIEEVLMVAEGELTLVSEIAESRVFVSLCLVPALANDDTRWEPLEEKAAPGQWEYFERSAHT
jgi:NADH dehydrogenase (ubiquinone) 1 alpha subcomplex subunit 5